MRMRSASTTAPNWPKPRRSGRARRRREMMLDGVTLIAPETVFFSHDTEIGADTVVEPNVYFATGVKIAGGRKSGLSAIWREQLSAAAARSARSRGCVQAPISARNRRSAISARSRRRRSRPALRSITFPISAMPGSARKPISAPERSPATMTATASSSPTSAQALSSARTQRWSRRSRSATERISLRAASSPRTCRTMPWPSAVRGRRPYRNAPDSCAKGGQRRRRNNRTRSPLCNRLDDIIEERPASLLLTRNDTTSDFCTARFHSRGALGRTIVELGFLKHVRNCWDCRPDAGGAADRRRAEAA